MPSTVRRIRSPSMERVVVLHALDEGITALDLLPVAGHEDSAS